MASTADWITQRYGEATCTLAVQGQPSALSRWTDQPLLKSVSFQLRLQPAAVETAPPSIEIQGDGAQLQALSSVVQTYVQQGRLAEASGTDPRADIRLTPLSLTQHQLHPGDLVVQGAEPPLTLGMLQLYDLATVLDQFEANALVQPPLTPALTPGLSPVAAAPQRPGRSWRSRRTWQVAASLVFAVGVTASVAQLVWRQPQPMLETSASRSTDEAADADDFAEDDVAESDLEGDRIASDPSPTALDGGTTEEADPQADPSESVGATPPPETFAPPTDQAPASAPLPEPPADRSASPSGSQPQPAPAAPAPTESEDVPETAAAPDQPETQFRAPLSAPQAARQALDRPQAVQAYLQELWQPPARLSQPLSYRLVVDGEGAIATLTPLDEISTTALDQTPLSSIEAGEPVFGPNPDGEATPLIVSLNPDGRVEVVLAPED